MKITRGKIPGAKKVVLYGPEGIGKSTFASKFPDPLFIDTEGSTKELDVARTDKPSSWAMLLSMVDEVSRDPSICRTLVIDTVDWAEQMCVQSICDKHHKDGLESFGYGSGYVYVKEEFGRFLNRLSDVVDAGINVVLTAHAQMRKFEQPDEMGAYDRWELKLGKKTSSQTSPMVKEWADMLLFANYKTISVAVDEKGKKHKAQGGRRVMYTTHHACWDAKNRYGLPDECPLDYEAIRSIIEPEAARTAETPARARKGAADNPDAAAKREQHAAAQALEAVAETQETRSGGAEAIQEEKDAVPRGEPVQAELPINQPEAQQGAREPGAEKARSGPDKRIAKRLRDLMEKDGVDEWSLHNTVMARLPGAFPPDMEVRDYPDDFIDEWILPNWGKIVEFTEKMKDEQEVPFN